MKKSQIIALLVALLIAILLYCFFSSGSRYLYHYTRGTVIRDDKSAEANILTSISEKKTTYNICVLDSLDRPTGKTFKLVKTKFPDGFDFAKDCEVVPESKAVVADIVDFKIVRPWVFWKRAEITKFKP